MTHVTKPKLGLYITSIAAIAGVSLALIKALPALTSADSVEAAAMFQFNNPYGAAVANPDVDGDWMTYVDFRDNNTANIYNYNFATGEEKMLTWNASPVDASVAVPKIDDGFVAYTNKLADGSYVLNYFNPYMYVNTNVSQSKDVISTPSFDNHNIVWTQANQVYWFDIDRNVSEQISVSSAKKTSAVVNGNTAYWLEENGSYWDIMKFELDYGIRKAVLTGQPIVGTISASGNNIAYTKTDGQQTDVYTVHAKTGAVTQVTKTGFSETNPVIFANHIAFDETIVSDTDPEIAVVDRKTGMKTTLTNDSLFHSTVSVAQHRLAWSDTRSGVSKVYVYDLLSSEDRIHHNTQKTSYLRISDAAPTAPAVPVVEQQDIDTDGDGLSDDKELNHYKTSVHRVDTDGDGLQDNDEIFTYHTDPLKFDSDEDGLGDGTEVKTGQNPLLKLGVDTRYGMKRFEKNVESVRAKQLKSALEGKLGKGQIGIHRDDWPFYANAYIYGGYSVEEVIRSSRGGYGIISDLVPAEQWRQTHQYRDAITF